MINKYMIKCKSVRKTNQDTDRESDRWMITVKSPGKGQRTENLGNSQDSPTFSKWAKEEAPAP